jgi:hypothetical protein
VNAPHLLIQGFGISGYRSFGSVIQRVGPVNKINLLIGQNNSGKSNILRFLKEQYNALIPFYQHGSELKPDDLDTYRGSERCPFRTSIAALLNAEHFEDLRRAHGPSVLEWLEAIYASRLLTNDGGAVWLETEVGRDFRAAIPKDLLDHALQVPGADQILRNLSNALTHASSDSATNALHVIRSLAQRILKRENIILIPAIRKPGKSQEDDKELSGADIIHRLAKLRDPKHNEQQKRLDYDRVQDFLRNVTDRPDARLEIPYDRETITVHMDGRALPLESLGTGIHEVIIIAAIATILRNHVVCIEEIELHLHPLLQKKLLRFLDEQTSNQYFITTHSAHLLDHPNSAIFHVQLTEKGSVVALVSDAKQKFAVCHDLGYRASDLLQTNCVIWVEGPSDRIYVREWIRLADPALLEGIHYSLMFYGGRLLSHLSAEDPEVKDFISLRRLNRNMVVIMDSDRGSKSSRINSTKRRIRNAWEGDKGTDDTGFAWITGGREIENYVSPDAMKESLLATASGKKHKRIGDRFDRCIGRDSKGRAYADKVKVAHWLVDGKKLNLDALDLRKQISKLVAFIRRSNHAPKIGNR